MLDKYGESPLKQVHEWVTACDSWHNFKKRFLRPFKKKEETDASECKYVTGPTGQRWWREAEKRDRQNQQGTPQSAAALSCVKVDPDVDCAPPDATAASPSATTGSLSHAQLSEPTATPGDRFPAPAVSLADRCGLTPGLLRRTTR